MAALPTRMRPTDQTVYGSIFEEIKQNMTPIDINDLRPTKGKVFKLTRYMGRTAPYWPIKPWVTSSYPLYLYHTAIHAMGQIETAKDILSIAEYIQSKLEHIPPKYHSDAYRCYLKQVSGYCFPKVFTHGPSYMLYVHMHWLTAKCPYTEQQIIDDIDEWVSDSMDNKPKELDARICERVLDRVFTTWYKGEADGYLTFKEYCNDYARWGTSGGAPRVRMDGQDYRSKWAWSIYHSTDPETGQLLPHYDLYAQALKERVTSTIALKEEPAKTREIITTTMASYLRQSYLMYRRGPPRIPSPISSSTWLGKFERAAPSWYGSIDGERFDHCIPAQFIIGIVNRLGKLDSETAWVAEKEVEHMKSLKVQWGDRTWQWSGGLLSGWRLTSVVGSLASCCVAEYILEKSNMVGAIHYGVMGDDLILYSYNEQLSIERMVEEYKAFGLKANMHKTSSGKVGEFLRRVISLGGNWAYPALGLRSVCYANPWLDHYTYNEETEVSNCWMTFLSRMWPHAVKGRGLMQFCLSHCIENLKQLFGELDWLSWLQTPISAGGGGCLEISDVSKWVVLDKVRDTSQYARATFLKMTFGLLPYKRVLKENPTLKKMDLEPVVHLRDDLQGTSTVPPDTWFRHGVNIIRTVNDFLYGLINVATLSRALTFSLPRGLRTSSPQRVIAFLMQGPKVYAGISTIQHTKEALQSYSYLGEYAVKAISNSKRYSNIRYIQAAVTIYMTQLMRNVYIPFGTW